jgi:hypothetical protein
LTRQLLVPKLLGPPAPLSSAHHHKHSLPLLPLMGPHLPSVVDPSADLLSHFGPPFPPPARFASLLSLT